MIDRTVLYREIDIYYGPFCSDNNLILILNFTSLLKVAVHKSILCPFIVVMNGNINNKTQIRVDF